MSFLTRFTHGEREIFVWRLNRHRQATGRLESRGRARKRLKHLLRPVVNQRTAGALRGKRRNSDGEREISGAERRDSEKGNAANYAERIGNAKLRCFVCSDMAAHVRTGPVINRRGTGENSPRGLLQTHVRQRHSRSKKQHCPSLFNEPDQLFERFCRKTNKTAHPLENKGSFKRSTREKRPRNNGGPTGARAQ